MDTFWRGVAIHGAEHDKCLAAALALKDLLTHEAITKFGQSGF